MLSTAEVSPRYRTSLPTLVGEITRSLTEIVNLLHAGAESDNAFIDVDLLADAARRLWEVSGALTIMDEHGLAALTQLFRTKLLACGQAGALRPGDAAKLAREVHQVMKRAFDGLLRGRRPVACDLFACWQHLEALGEASGLHPSALISLDADTSSLSPLPSELAMGVGLDAAEPALLAFLRAQDDAERSNAALRIADVLVHASAKASDADEHAYWRTLRAYLIEFAQAGGDALRAKKIVAGTVRALRHLGEGGSAVAPLAREALFEWTQRTLVSDEARAMARLFALDRQWPARIEETEATQDAQESASGFADAVGTLIAAIEEAPDKLTDCSSWRALADVAAIDPYLSSAEIWLRDIAARVDNGEPDSHVALAAILLCVQACANQGGNTRDLLAGLMRATNDREPWRYLHEWSRASGAHALMLDLSSALHAEMLAAEQALDTQADTQAARAIVIASLTRIAGALQLLSTDDDCDAVLALRRCLEAADSSVAVFDEATALQWVQLQASFVLLPWRVHESPTELSPPSVAKHTAQQLSEADSTLVSVFIDEAGGLLREIRLHAAEPNLEAIMHAAHTLAGCSATVGATAISELAHALEEMIVHGAAPDQAALDIMLGALDGMLSEFSGSEFTDSNDSGNDPALVQIEGVTDHAGILDDVIALPLSESAVAPVPDIVIEETVDIEPLQREPIVDLSDIPEEIEAAAVPQPEPAVIEQRNAYNDAEAELLAIFHEEAADLLPQVEQAVRLWQQQPEDRDQAAQLLRLLHTLKGSARMAGQQALGEDFHLAEAEIGTLSQQTTASIAAQLPALQERVDGWLQSLADTRYPAAEQRHWPDSELTAASPVPQEEAPSPLLRVRADRLTQFADSSAEIWIGNARIREGLQEQGRAVTDLSDDLARLRAQLRELEIEAESRILSRAAQGSASDFDPLEFDRYTRLHELTRMMAESLTDIAGVQRLLVRQLETLGSAASAQARDLRRQQAELQALRSQPLRAVDARLRHLLRQAAREAGREVELRIDGADIEIERGLLDRLMGPLEHLLRNAVVHGIEPADERERCGKPRAGQVVLLAAIAGNELRLKLSDDGRGLDLSRIRERALAAGMLREPETEAHALADLIFEPGFSTASEVTALSGRGIGMDAVRVELQALGGRIDVHSEAGRGCTFAMTLPASTANVRVILASAGGRRVALPAALLQQVLQLDPAQIKSADDVCLIEWQGQAIRLILLGEVFGASASPVDHARVPVAVLRDGERLLAVQLDAIEGQREVIIKHPGPQLARVPGLSGAILLGDGGIALIMDPFRLPAITSVGQAPTGAKRPRLVMVVDDSLTVRRASQRLLERHGYAVALARDGIEALEQLQQQRPLAVLLDIEMPRMDGFELLAALRDDARWHGLPVVMITSRIAERHRERAMSLGATAYMGKPFDETALLALLSQVVTPEAAA